MTIPRTLTQPQTRPLRISEVKRCVCLYYKLTEQDLLKNSRKHKFAHPRQLAMFLCRELLGVSYPKISHYFGDRDHTTAVHGVQAVVKRCGCDPKYQEEVEKLRRVLILLSAANEAGNDTAVFVIPVDTTPVKADINHEV